MNFAFLGFDARLLSLANAISHHREHQLVFACSDLSIGAAQAELFQECREHISWESGAWLAEVQATRPDVLVIAAEQDSARLVSRLRIVSELEIPCIVSHPLNHSAMAYYELEILINEGRAVLLPYVPARRERAVQKLRKEIDGQASGDSSLQLGRLEQLTLDRTSTSATRLELLDAFTSDVDIIRYLVGDIRDVGAMHSGSPGQVPIPLSVQMNSRNEILVRWSLATAATSGARLTLTGSQGKVVLHMPAEDEWQLDDGSSGRGAGAMADPGSDVVSGLLRNLDDVGRDPDLARDVWQDVTRSVETTEALEKSLRKGRVVHISYEGRGERAAFMGTMASVGCGLLIAMLFVTVLSAVGLKIAKEQNLEGLALWIGRVPYVFLGLLVVFLGLQLLRYAIPRRE